MAIPLARPPREARAILDSAVAEPEGDAQDRLLDSRSDALTARLALPARDPAALAAKPTSSSPP